MTRRILRILGSRYGIAAILVVIVVVVVALAQANSDPRPNGSRQQDGTVDNVSPGAPDDGYAEPDTPQGSASPSADALPEAAVDVATQFAGLWLNQDGLDEQQWYDRLVPLATEATQRQLAGVDPANVPATELTGEPTISGPSVVFDTDRGLLTLTMTEDDGVWKVSGVDFDYSPS